MPATDPIDPYAAMVDDGAGGGVRAHLPLLPIGADTTPSTGNVEHYLRTLSNSLRARIGDLAGHADADALTAAARDVVEVGAAAMAEDAAFPERADQADTSYGNVLWARYRQLLADLLITLGIDPDQPGTTPGAGGAAGAGIASSFPPPLFARDTAY